MKERPKLGRRAREDRKGKCKRRGEKRERPNKIRGDEREQV